jgi:hypothetical protein
MTARSGDALSHVDFQVQLKVVLSQLRTPEFGPLPSRDAAPFPER